MPMVHPNKVAANGFTVVEMMITLVIAAILMMVVVPGFSDMLANSRMRSEVYGLRGVLMEARSVAMTERQNVSVRRSSNGSTVAADWNTARPVEGYIAFVDMDGDGALEAADGDRIVLSRTPDQATVTLSFDNTEDRVTYNSRGNAQLADKSFNGTFTFCDKRGATKAAGLIVSRIGTTTAAVDSDPTPDEIADDPAGTNLACP